MDPKEKASTQSQTVEKKTTTVGTQTTSTEDSILRHPTETAEDLIHLRERVKQLVLKVLDRCSEPEEEARYFRGNLLFVLLEHREDLEEVWKEELAEWDLELFTDLLSTPVVSSTESEEEASAEAEADVED